ncbi:MAG: N(G),N(G)-dimethylarginine dimethylaminohydrolase [Bacteroidetes bacterium]|nr:N(G),N(G)-dimethylarginine dimethylaminohydrolase [Bacteroidota bacterium]
MFKNAIVRKPCPEIISGLTSVSLGKPDYNKALDQHAGYVEALRSCGLNVKVLEADSQFPDSVFVEDVALCTSECAIVTNPGAPSRNDEKLEMNAVLKSFYKHIEAIEAPGTLDAGDVMMVGKHFYIGISERTNGQGAEQLISYLERYGMTGSMVPLKEMLHLKSGLSYLEQNHLLITGEFINHPAFADFQKIKVDPDESYAANSLWVNSTVLVPAGFPRTLAKIKQAGYHTLILDVSEFRKLDGGLSCLSLRF